MRNSLAFLFCLCVVIPTTLPVYSADTEPLVLPHPQQMKILPDTLQVLSDGKPNVSLVIEARGDEAQVAGEWIQNALYKQAGMSLSVLSRVPSQGNCIILHRPDSARYKALVSRYTLDFSVSPDPKQAYAIVPECNEKFNRIHLLAPDEKGLVYAAYTLAQLFSTTDNTCKLTLARVLDYPAAPVRGMLWVRGDDSYRANYSLWAASFKMNAYTWYVPWDTPLSPEFQDILRNCQNHGMTLIPTISWFQNTDIRYSDPNYINPMLQRVREALGAGAGAFGFNFDDIPLKLFGADEQAFGSLVEAQGSLLQKAAQITDPAGAWLLFCPTIYWEPYAGAQGNNKDVQFDYIRGMGKYFPASTKTFTTTLSAKWAEQTQELTGRKPVFWHNFFPNDCADWKLYFEPYPRFQQELVPRSQGAFVLGGWQTDLWKVNYLTFASNTWNPQHPCTLEEAFIRLYPTESKNLIQYTLLMGSHNEPADEMEWDGTHPHQVLRPETFFNLDPTPENIKSLETRLNNAMQAKTIAEEIAGRNEVPAAQAQELIAMAERMRLNYRMALTAILLRQMEQNGERNRLASDETKQMLDEAITAGDQIEKVITSVGWPLGNASDLSLKSWFTGLQERLKSGQGAIPILRATQCESAPVLDGKLDEPDWEKTSGSSQFYNIEGSPRPAAQQTEVRILFSDDALYLGFVCHENKMDALKTVMTRRDDSVWEDDCIELFIDPLRDRKNYLHFVVNSAGVQFDEKITDGIKDADWNGDWSAMTQLGKDRWFVELKVPFATLGITTPTSTQRLGFNAAREEVPSNEVSAWALTFGSFHQPAMFGDLSFGTMQDVVTIEAERAVETNFQYGIQLASNRVEALGMNGTGYLNLNVAHPNGPSGDTPDGSPDWFAKWNFIAPYDGAYELWVLGSDAISGLASWQVDDRKLQTEERLLSAPAAPSYPRPLEIGNWHRIKLDAAENLTTGEHTLTLRVIANDPSVSKRCGYFIDTIVLAPQGWRP